MNTNKAIFWMSWKGSLVLGIIFLIFALAPVPYLYSHTPAAEGERGAFIFFSVVPSLIAFAGCVHVVVHFPVYKGTELVMVFFTIISFFFIGALCSGRGMTDPVAQNALWIWLWTVGYGLILALIRSNALHILETENLQTV